MSPVPPPRPNLFSNAPWSPDKSITGNRAEESIAKFGKWSGVTHEECQISRGHQDSYNCRRAVKAHMEKQIYPYSMYERHKNGERIPSSPYSSRHASHRETNIRLKSKEMFSAISVRRKKKKRRVGRIGTVSPKPRSSFRPQQRNRKSWIWEFRQFVGSTEGLAPILSHEPFPFPFFVWALDCQYLVVLMYIYI